MDVQIGLSEVLFFWLIEKTSQSFDQMDFAVVEAFEG